MADRSIGFGLSVFLWILVSCTVATDPSIQELDALHFSSELEQLKSKISFLESKINERNYELREKDQSIVQMEKLIQDKLERVASLESEISLLQENGVSDNKEYSSKEHEKQVDRLRKEIEVQNQKKDILEARADNTERKIHELNLKLENLQNINQEQKTRTSKTEQALQAAEEEIMKVALEESSISRKVTQEWIPNLTEQWLLFTTYLKPHVRYLVTRTVDVYYKVKNSGVPQIVQETKDFTKPYIDQMVAVAKPLLEKAQIALEPHQAYVVDAYEKFINFAALYYHEETKDFTKPYIDQMMAVAKPLMKKAQIALEPYQEYVVDTCQRFIKFAALYHHKVQEVLKNNELTRPFAVVDMAWFVATTSLALPVIFLYNLCFRIFSKGPRKYVHISNLNRTRRKAKRSYPY